MPIPTIDPGNRVKEDGQTPPTLYSLLTMTIGFFEMEQWAAFWFEAGQIIAVLGSQSPLANAVWDMGHDPDHRFDGTMGNAEAAAQLLRDLFETLNRTGDKATTP